MSTTTETEIDMASAKTTARWQHYETILARAGIGHEERERVLLADARDRCRAAKEAEREAREACLRATARP